MNLETLLQNAFYLFLGLKTMTQLALGVKNRRYMKRHYHKVPSSMKAHLSLKEHQKSIRYHIEKSLLNKWQVQFDALILLALFPLGGINWLDTYLRSLTSSSLHRGVLFFLILSFLGLLISQPFKLYQTFKIEEKFGFNNTSFKLYCLDTFKQILLMLIITTPLLYIVLWIFQETGFYWWLYAWASLTGFQFFILWLYPNFIAPIFNEFTPLSDESLKQDIIKLATKTRFKASDIKVMDASKRSSHGNAYFTGLGSKKKIVFFDTLLKNLSNNEILAVLAHELGHFAKKHIIKMLITSLVSSFIGFAILGYLSPHHFFYTGHFINQPSAYSCLFIFLSVLPFYTFYLTPLSNFLSRKHEFEADQFACEHTNNNDLKNALIKLQKHNSSVVTIDPLFASFYYSHPPLLERLGRL